LVDGDVDPRALLSKADTNLYSAKRAGKNKVVS
jgi:PleD family two-component response regulator